MKNNLVCQLNVGMKGRGVAPVCVVGRESCLLPIERE